jgi:hypothetical protein
MWTQTISKSRRLIALASFGIWGAVTQSPISRTGLPEYTVYSSTDIPRLLSWSTNPLLKLRVLLILLEGHLQ